MEPARQALLTAAGKGFYVNARLQSRPQSVDSLRLGHVPGKIAIAATKQMVNQHDRRSGAGVFAGVAARVKKLSKTQRRLHAQMATPAAATWWAWSPMALPCWAWATSARWQASR